MPAKTILLYIMVLLYIVAGLNHFFNPRFYLKIMPPYIPYHLAMVYISGVCEVLFAILLIPIATRHIAAWLLILLLIAIFPANVQMAIDFWKKHNPYLSIAILRLPLQLPLIYWAYQYTK